MLGTSLTKHPTQFYIHYTRQAIYLKIHEELWRTRKRKRDYSHNTAQKQKHIT